MIEDSVGLRFVDLGCLPFADALSRQEELVSRIAEGRAEETVHLVEHPHVFTLGRRGDASNLLRASDAQGNPIEPVRIGRGGDITYHGPGQLVGYPHLDLRRRGRDVHRYLRSLEQILILTADSYGIPAFRRPGLTGVWTQTGKLASIGVGVRRWITMHGFALNVSTDLDYFRWINPCGIEACPVTSLSDLLGRTVAMEEVKGVVQEKLVGAFAPLSPLAEAPPHIRGNRT